MSIEIIHSNCYNYLMIEIQIHPSDIRKKVRFYFISSKKLKILGIISVLIIFFFCFAIVMAPTSYVKEITKNYYKLEKKQNAYLKNEIQKLISFYKENEEKLIKLREKYEHLYLLYGIPFNSKGLGGTTIVKIPKQKEPEEVIPLYYERVQELLNVSEKLYEEISIYDEKYKSLSLFTPSISPLPYGSYLLTSVFGQRINPFTNKSEFHQGIDFSCPEGTETYATAYGKVTYSGRYPLSLNVGWWRYGNLVVINHNNNFITIYAHLSKTFVKRGDNVKRGQKIAQTGNSGWSTRPHLHYEVRRLSLDQDYICVDPRIYILDLEWKEMGKILKMTKDNLGKDFEPLPNPFKN